MTKYVCIGLARTGTGSLTRAMEQLGFSTIHDATRATAAYRDAIMKDLPPLSHLNADFYADAPFYYVFPRIAAYYPDTKFIITIRNKDDWLASKARQHSGMPDRAKAQWPRMYDTHKKMIEDFFAAGYGDRTLTLDIINGDDNDLWNELCKFTNKPVPDTPFPWEHRKL